MTEQSPASRDVITKAPTAKATASADFGTGADAGRLTITSGIEIPLMGYLGAIRRFETAAAQLPPERAFAVHVALFEALNWLNSMVVGARDGAIGSSPVKHLEVDKHVLGLGFVRGRAHHHWAQQIYADPSSGEWLWQRHEVLPVPPEGSYNQGREEYVVNLERKSVLASLQHVERLLPVSPLG
jgi:hypothetical protein